MAPPPERAIFLDRDNTIIDNDGYLGDPSKVKLLTGAATALSAIRALGYRLIVVSNQSGVARGMFDEAAVEAVNQEMCRQLRQQANATIDASYYCPYHPEAPIAEYKVDHDWRKPRPGMLKQAATDFNLDLSQSWTIGDMPRDIAAGAAVGTRTILLRDPDHPAPENESNALPVSPNYIVKSLADAVRIIAREGKTSQQHRDQSSSTTSKLSESPPSPLPVPPVPAASEIPVAKSPASASPAMPQTLLSPASAPSTSTLKLEKSLDELLIHLRQQARNADLAPEFGMLHYASLLIQILAALSFFAGFYYFVSAGSTFKDWPAIFSSVTSLERAACWLLIALTLQGLVITLLLHARKK